MSAVSMGSAGIMERSNVSKGGITVNHMNEINVNRDLIIDSNEYGYFIRLGMTPLVLDRMRCQQFRWAVLASWNVLMYRRVESL